MDDSEELIRIPFKCGMVNTQEMACLCVEVTLVLNKVKHPGAHLGGLNSQLVARTALIQRLFIAFMLSDVDYYTRSAPWSGAATPWPWPTQSEATP